MTFSRINLWIDNSNGATGWMVRATRTDGRVVEEAIGSLQGDVRGRYDLPRWATEDAADALGLESLAGPAAWSWTGQVYTIEPDADPVAAIDSDIIAAADAWEEQGGQHAIVDADVEAIAQKNGIRGGFVVARAEAIGVPVL